MKIQINADKLNHKDSILTCKAEIPSIVNTLNKIIIPRDVYDTYVSNFYCDHNVTLFNLDFKTNSKQSLNELEHPSLITEREINMDEANNTGYSEKKTHINH